ncbi:hypothetical protein [Dactylosporangium sp. CA-139066]|uniref:hypothetical protein n=1 Tax=Dactylosporangium sp. CA-139066 TaxID=3239930 RepID=UPI003D8EE104
MNGTTPTPTPSPAMQSLDRLVGTWQLSGDSTGTVTYEWMEGGQDSLTIWGGEPASLSYYKGTFVDEDTNVGQWTFPGGGYTSTMHRIAR